MRFRVCVLVAMGGGGLWASAGVGFSLVLLWVMFGRGQTPLLSSHEVPGQRAGVGTI
jgi:hypothetical protein